MQNYLAKKDFETLSLEKVDESRKKEILNIKNSITLSYEDTLNYANSD